MNVYLLLLSLSLAWSMNKGVPTQKKWYTLTLTRPQLKLLLCHVRKTKERATEQKKVIEEEAK